MPLEPAQPFTCRRAGQHQRRHADRQLETAISAPLNRRHVQPPNHKATPIMAKAMCPTTHFTELSRSR